MAYTDSTKVTNFLQRALTAYETAALNDYIAAVKKWIDKRLSSTFDSVSATTRYYNGGVRNLDIDPCTDITEVEAVNDDGSDSYIYTQPYEIVLEPQNDTVKRSIHKRLSSFPRGISRIAVTAKFSEYDSNDDGVPSDIVVLATRLVAGLINSGKYQATGGNVMQESLEGHEIRYLPTSADVQGMAANDPTVQSILAARADLLIDDADPRNELGASDDDGGLLI